MQGVMRYLSVLLLLSTLGFAQAGQTCKVTFAVVRKDEAGDLLNGFRPKTLEWFEKKMVKKYPGVCYSEDAANATVVLFFSAIPAVYHGVRTISTTDTSNSPVNGSITDNNGQQVGTIDGTVATTTTTTSNVPYEVDYERLHLAIEYKFSDGWKPVESFDGKTLHPTFYGFCTRNCHPNNSMIEDAIKYLQGSGLKTPRAAALP
jgi:hypothetical protein